MDKNNYDKVLELIYSLRSKGILESIFPIKDRIKRIYLYYSTAKLRSRFTIASYGVSFESRSLAMLKCLGELAERISIRLSGRKGKSLIASGIAADFDERRAILNGIYELTERDAFMTGYLNNISPPYIDWRYIKSKKVISLVNYLNKTGFEYRPYEITNDINIPTFLVFILGKKNENEKQSLIISAGLKSNIDPVKAIVGATEESYLDHVLKINNINLIKNNHIALFHKSIFTNEKCQKLYFSTRTLTKPKLKANKSVEELSYLKKIYSKKGFDISCKDIAPSFFRNILYKVIRTEIAGLQPLFFNSKDKFIIRRRLEEVRRYFDS